MELDLGRVRALASPDTEAGRASLAELFGAYVDHMRPALALMRDAIAEGDSGQIRALAHDQKGASSMVGARRIAAALAAIEAAPGDSAIVHPAVAEIALSLARVEKEIRALVGGTGTP